MGHHFQSHRTVDLSSIGLLGVMETCTNYVVAGVLWEMVGDDGVVWVLVPVGDWALGLR